MGEQGQRAVARRNARRSSGSRRLRGRTIRRIMRSVVFAGLLTAVWLTNCSDPIVAPNKPPETPSNPTPAAFANTASPALAVDTQGSYIYVGCSAGLQVIDNSPLE